MKIVQINTGIGFGSVGRIADQIGSLIEKNGGTCYYVHGSRYIVHTAPTAIQVGTMCEDYVHYAITLLTGKDGVGSYYATRRLIRKLRAIHPDIVHLHNIHGYYINYKLLFRYLAEQQIPVVWTFHDCWPITGHCPYFDSVYCMKWKSGCYACPLRKDFPKSLFFDQSSFSYKEKKKAFSSIQNLNIIPASDWLGNIVKESFLKNANIKVIHNGIDLSIFKPRIGELRNRLGVSIDKKIVLGVASGWDERKGFSDFIKLAEYCEWQIIMVGSIDTTVDSSKLPGSIIHVKNTNNQIELAEYYSMADVFINPTYSDNFPTTNIEALACGTPVVTYNTGGSPEAIDENTGVVVEQGNIDALVNAIRTILINGKEYYQKLCRNRAELLFDKNNCFEDYIGIYNNIMNK